jgi:hypothetical protein
MRRRGHPRHQPGHRPDGGGLTDLRRDLAFAVGVVSDALRNRPFAS